MIHNLHSPIADLRSGGWNGNRKLLGERAALLVAINIATRERLPFAIVGAAVYSHGTNEFGRRGNVKSDIGYGLFHCAQIGSPRRALRHWLRWRLQYDGQKNSFRGFDGLIEDVRAGDRKLLGAVEDLQAQKVRIVLRVMHHLSSFMTILPEAEHRRALLHMAPDSAVVARFHAHPFDKVRFRSLNLDGIVKGRLVSDFKYYLGVPARRETVLVELGHPRNCVFRAFADEDGKRGLRALVVHHANVGQPQQGPLINFGWDGHSGEPRRSNWGELDRA